MNPLQTSTPAGPALRGEVLRPGDGAYDAARRVHNAMIDRHPLLVAQVADAADVAAALAFAREHELALAVRGGGHSSFGVAAGGLTIDLRALRRVDVDAAARTVRVGAGALTGELDAALARHGLALTGGRHPSVGVAGFTTGSGSGWLERAMGLAADNLRSATLVTADGRAVTASPTEHPDLFWALRGGGGNFGVLTELEFRTMALGPQVLGGLRLYPAERAAEVVTAYAQVMAGAPDALCGGLALACAPPAPFVPAELHGRPVVLNLVLWAGDLGEGRAGIAPLAALGEPLVDLVQPMPYPALQGLMAPPPGAPPMRSYLKFGVLDALTDRAVASLALLGEELCTKQSAVLLQPLGGAFGRVGETDTALGERGAALAYQIVTVWPDAADDASHIAWTRAAAAELAEFGRTAPWPNYVAADEGRRLAVPYAPRTLERLRAVKRAWDPQNLFRANHIIAPLG
jgi:FAD/FMN-containing dehydrogenase